jgi:hypothetical protein
VNITGVPPAAEQFEVDVGGFSGKMSFVIIRHLDDGGRALGVGSDGGLALGVGSVEARVGDGGAPGPAHFAAVRDGAGWQEDEDGHQHVAWQIDDQGAHGHVRWASDYGRLVHQIFLMYMYGLGIVS